MTDMDKVKKNVFRERRDMEGTPIRGYDFNKDFSVDEFLASYMTTGFQATHLAQGIDIIKKMREEKATIFLGFTSNIVSSGLREILAYLAKNKLVHAIVTTGGGIEEDIIKAKKPFILGSFEADDLKLEKECINRIGNILVPSDRYMEFETFLNKVLEGLYRKQESSGEIISGVSFIRAMASELEDENSFLYWAYKNEIPVYAHALLDGSIGDITYFFKKNNPGFKIDMTDDTVSLVDQALGSDKTGVIALGGGPAKHSIINSNLFRGGADYAVYVSTATEGDGSLSGAKPSEAVTWGKIKRDVTTANIEADVTIVFPLLVLGGFR